MIFWDPNDEDLMVKRMGRFDPFADLPLSSCVASTMIAAEEYKALEILRSRVEEALNVLRYLGAIVWHNQPARHIYLAGFEPARSYYAFSTDDVGKSNWFRESLFYPSPFLVDQIFLGASQGYGLKDYSAWLEAGEAALPLEKQVINAIQWFGDAAQESNSLQAFMKYYIAVESLLKVEKRESWRCAS